MIESLIKFVLFFETKLTNARRKLRLTLEHRANKEYEAFIKENFPGVNTEIVLWEDRSDGEEEYWTHVYTGFQDFEKALRLEEQIIRSWCKSPKYDYRFKSWVQDEYIPEHVSNLEIK